MDYPNLRAALDMGVGTLQSLLKQLVPVDSGSLRDSIVLDAVVDGVGIKLVVELNYYYKYITAVGTHRRVKEPVPVDEVLHLSPTIAVSRYGSLNSAISAMIDSLNAALVRDIELELGKRLR